MQLMFQHIAGCSLGNIEKRADSLDMTHACVHSGELINTVVTDGSDTAVSAHPSLQ
jgi:hypothetical protein